MKKLLVLVGVLVAINCVSAQEGMHERRAHAQKKIEVYKERLQLSEAQIESLQALKQKHRPEMQQIRQDESISRGDKMRATADLIDQHEQEMASILSNEQLEEWEVIKKEVRAERHQRGEMKRKHRKDC